MRATASRMRNSVSVSTLEVASSRIRNRGLCASARAKLINCFCPVDRPLPRSRTGCVKPVRQRADELQQVDLLGGGLQVLAGDALGPEPDVVLDRSREQVRILQHEAEVAAQLARVEFAQYRRRRPG